MVLLLAKVVEILNKKRDGLTIYYFIDEAKNPDLSGLLEKIFFWRE
jgi:ArsR family transcriptional regulator, lead/cadmium/zinc/bismuth-responsive transcriptional repressor